MSKHQVNRSAICPYYQHESISTIYCTGITPNVNLIHLAFLNPKECLRHKQECCRKRFDKCAVYDMLLKNDGGCSE